MSEHVDLTKDNLDTTASIAALGALSAKLLKENGQVTFYLDPAGNVHLATAEQVTLNVFADTHLDALTVEEAIRILLSAGVQEEIVKSYLRRRDSKEKLIDKSVAG